MTEIAIGDICIARMAGLVWSRAKVRKAHQCCQCKCDIGKGSWAFLPITNGYDRYKRVCVECMTALAAEKRYAE